MVFLSEKEKTDILSMVGYGDRKRTQQEVCDLFNQRYPNRVAITQSCVSKLVKKYNETGTVKDRRRSGRPKAATGGDVGLNVLIDLQDNPKQSLRQLSLNHHVSFQSVLNLLKREKIRPYKIHLVQELVEDDFYRRSEFCEVLMEKCNVDPNFVYNIIFSDEATFMLNGTVNRHNCRYWSQINPRWMEEVKTQKPQKVNVWTGIVGHNFIGPFFINGNLTSEVYLNLLVENVIPQLEVLYPDRQNIWFQQDGAPAHFGLIVRNFLNETFPNQWIGRRGEIEWPARSPDLTPLDFYLWGYLKDKVYENKPENIEDLKAKIVNEMRHIPRITFDNVLREFRDRLGYCLAQNGRHFEHLIK